MSQKGAAQKRLIGEPAREPPASSSAGRERSTASRNNRLDDDRVICEDRCGISDVLFFCTFLVYCIFTE